MTRTRLRHPVAVAVHSVMAPARTSRSNGVWLKSATGVSMLNPLESLPRKIRPFEGSVVPGWNVRRVWWLSLALTCAAVLVVYLTSPSVDLIGLLVVGPCCALLTGQWRTTSLIAALTVGSATAMAARFGGIMTAEHLAFLTAVIVVSAVCIVCTILVERLALRSQHP